MWGLRLIRHLRTRGRRWWALFVRCLESGRAGVTLPAAPRAVCGDDVSGSSRTCVWQVPDTVAGRLFAFRSVDKTSEFLGADAGSPRTG